MKIWMCEDKGDKSQSCFGKTRSEAVQGVLNNRGFTTFEELKENDWVKDPIRIEVPAAVAAVLLRSSR